MGLYTASREGQGALLDSGAICQNRSKVQKHALSDLGKSRNPSQDDITKRPGFFFFSLGSNVGALGQVTASSLEWGLIMASHQAGPRKK